MYIEFTSVFKVVFYSKSEERRFSKILLINIIYKKGLSKKNAQYTSTFVIARYWTWVNTRHDKLNFGLDKQAPGCWVIDTREWPRCWTV